MSELKYVQSGAFMLCNKCIAPVPVPLQVTSQATVTLPGGLLATTFDERLLENVPPFGVCGITHGPCTYAPLPPGWHPVQELVQAGPLGGHPLLENSKMRCRVGGEISLFLTRQAAMDTLPDIVSRGLASLYASMEGIPLLAGFQLEVGLVRGAWQGVYAMAEGLVELAKLDLKLKMAVGNAVVFAAMHPVEAAHAVAEGTQKAVAAGWQAVTDKDNWATAGEVAVNAVPGVLLVKGGIWLSDADNRAKLGKAYDVAAAYGQQLTPFERANLAGRAIFEVFALFGAPETKVAELGKVGELAKVGEVATDGVRLAGEVTTGAKGLAEAEVLEKAPSTVEEVFAGIEGCFKEGHPVDIATGLLFTQATDFTLPGPLPLVWERVWLSASTHQGALGHGWRHAYDLSLTLADGGRATLRLPDGRLADFAVPAPGERSFHRRHQLELAWEAAGPRVWDLARRCWYGFGEAAPLAESAEASARQWQLHAVEDSQGQRISLAYTGAGHLTAITDSAGRVLTCETDAAGRLLEVHAPDPDQLGATFPLVRYAYDEAGDLRTVTDALGHAAHFTYEGHLLTRETFRSGLNFYFEYDGAGPTARCVHTWGDGGIFDTKLRYDSPTQTIVWDSYDHEKVYVHRQGLPVYLRERTGGVWRWHYNPSMEVERVVDPLGQVTRYEYDAHGRQTRVTHPDGATTAKGYNAQGQLVQGTDATGGTWQWQYDEKGRRTASTDPTGATTTYAHDTRGRLSLITDALGHATRLRYDAQGNLAHIIAPDERIRSRQYDALGRLVALTDARGHVERRHYDRLGQFVGVQRPDGSVQRYIYDAQGNVVRADDGRQPVEFSYTPLGQLAQRRQDGQAVVFGYDLEGRLTQLTNEHGEAYSFELDAAGQVVEEVGFDGLTQRYERDLAGRVVQVQRPAGRTTAYAYDAAGRVAEVLHNGSERTAYRYRPDGALLEATTEATAISFERDALGRVLAETQNGHTVRNTYDTRGQRLSLASSLGATVQFERDALGQVSHTQAGVWQSVVGRDAEGLELHRQLSGGVRLDWQHDALGRPASQRLSAGGHAQRQRCYHWLGADQLVEIDDSQFGTTRYGYDPWGTLMGATYAEGEADVRQSDAVGNLFRTVERTDRRYAKGGQLQQAGGTRYKYDAEGNLVRKTLADGQAWHYSWDGAGQLAQVRRPDGYAVTFGYDAFGRRVRKRFRGKVTCWVWDGDKPLHEWSELEVGPGAGSVEELTTWLFEDVSFSPMAKLTAQGAYSVVSDHLGTPLALYDEQGKQTWGMELDSYGGVHQGRGKATDCPFRYQGQYEDQETGLYYNRFRYYDPEMGHYLSQDPLRLSTRGNQLLCVHSQPQQLVRCFRVGTYARKSRGCRCFWHFGRGTR